MRTRVDARLLAEVERYKLRFNCEQCAHFVQDTERCANEYPNEAHREGALLAAELMFCKEFELS